MEGNRFADWTAELCLELDAAGKEFAVESSEPTGRYPKIWDMPSMARLRVLTGARIVPLKMCPWGLQPAVCRSFSERGPGGW